MIKAEIILDSIGEHGERLTTMAVQFPRFILAEFNKHRAFSNNARSTRAVPTSQLIEEVRSCPVLPEKWGSRQSGMSSGPELEGQLRQEVEAAYREAAQSAANFAEKLYSLGLAKEYAGRIVENFTDTYVCVSSTEWQNFFSLRISPNAQTEIRLLAEQMRDCLENSTPNLVEYGQYHIPWLREEDIKLKLVEKIYVSAARSARVSYKTFDDNKISTLEKDLELGARLLKDRHSVCFEHQARSSNYSDYNYRNLRGNFTGWAQVRKSIELAGSI